MSAENPAGTVGTERERGKSGIMNEPPDTPQPDKTIKVDRFMDTLVGDDEEVGLNLEIDYEKLQYLCISEKRDVYDKILLKIGEAFLVRKERRLCGDGELSKVVGSEIYGKNDQKRLILEDIRIPGLYSLIQQYKSDGKTETSGAEGDKKTDSAVKNDTSEGTENGASKNAGADNASSEGDMSKDSAQTANGEKNGNTSSNEDKGEEDNKQERGAGGNSNLPYFFQGLNYQNLDPNDSDSHGVSRACKEIQLFSNRKLVDNFPMAAAFLTRTIIEHALIYVIGQGLGNIFSGLFGGIPLLHFLHYKKF